jgi:hypothetical protein
MATQNEAKLKTLFKILQPGLVVTGKWLEKHGISRDLQKHYLKNGWMQPIGRGAYKKPDDKVEWPGAMNAIQKQLKIKVHVGALSALSLHGYSHYIRMSDETLYVLSPLKTNLPKWFTDYNWNLKVNHKHTSFIPEGLGVTEYEVNKIQVAISTPERAILECLLLAPDNMDLVECYQIMEGLVNLKPKLVNELLQNCNSVQVKRLFLYMADKAKHQWLKFLKTEDIDIGKGNRLISEKGVYNSRYLISIPKELAEL